MSASMVNLSRRDLKGIQNTVLKVCKANKMFRNDVAELGFRYVSSTYDTLKGSELVQYSKGSRDTKLILRWLDLNEFKPVSEEVYKRDFGSFECLYSFGEHFFRGSDGSITDIEGNVIIGSDGSFGEFPMWFFCSNMLSYLKEDSGDLIWDIGSDVKYSWEVLYNILYSYKLVSKGDTDVTVKSPVVGIDFNEFVPNLFSAKYKWSKPVECEELGSFFEHSLDCQFGSVDMGVVHIHMVGDEMVWDAYSNYEMVRSVASRDLNHIPKLGYNSEVLMKRLKKVFKGAVVKEVYVVRGREGYNQGKVIVRKNTDGELTVTVY